MWQFDTGSMILVFIMEYAPEGYYVHFIKGISQNLRILLT